MKIIIIFVGILIGWFWYAPQIGNLISVLNYIVYILWALLYSLHFTPLNQRRWYKTNIYNLINLVRAGSIYVDFIFRVPPSYSRLILIFPLFTFPSEKTFSFHFPVLLFHQFSQLWIRPIKLSKLLVTFKGFTLYIQILKLPLIVPYIMYHNFLEQTPPHFAEFLDLIVRVSHFILKNSYICIGCKTYTLLR